MKTRRFLLIGGLMGCLAFAGAAVPQQAEAGHRSSRFGITFGTPYGSFHLGSRGNYRKHLRRTRRDWRRLQRHAPHYDYHPGGFYRHRNHYHYVPGHHHLHYGRHH